MTDKKIVVAYDNSPNSKNALKLAAEIAQTIGAKISLVSVVEQNFSLYQGEIGVRDFQKIQQAIDEFGKEMMESGVKLAQELGIEVKTALLSGNPANELLRYAQEENAYMIVVGPRGLGGLKGVLLGSVTQKILNHSPIPVVVAK